MRWPWQSEKRSAPYTDAITAAIIARAGGGASASVVTTAAVEASAALMARAFASAKLTPEIPAVTPAILAAIGREIIRRGEAVFVIDVDASGLRLTAANAWDITGGVDPESWFYRLDLAAPSGTAERSAPYAGVVHVRPYVEPSAPWRGIPPSEAAALTARLLAETEAALADESAGTRGYLLPVPQGPEDGDEDPLAKFRADIAGLKGKTALVETTSAGFGEGKAAAPQVDYMPRRIGANPPDALRAIRSDAEGGILGACGVPVELIMARSDGAAVREAWRRFAHATLSPLGEMVAAELADKLDRPGLAVSFDRLFASDISGRARAFASMVNGGMEIERAAGLSGLLAGE